MMNPFVYDIPTKVYFGPGKLEHLGAELAALGKRVLLCYGGGSIKRSGLYDRVVAQIQGAGLELWELPGIDPNPRVTSVRQGAQLCKEHGIDVVLAVGGGSVLDCAKFAAAGACYDGDPWDFSTGAAAPERALPLVTVLTLAATGSEMDNGGVITNLETKEKLGRGYPCMQPKVSFLDPTETFTVSRYQTACGSADILSHLFEIYFVTGDESMYLLDCFKEGMIKTVMKYAPIALEQPDNYEARANLMWTSSWAINGFAGAMQRSGWSCHPMEHELSAFYDITHGLGLAILTPRWMRYILDEDTQGRFYQYGVNVFGLDPALPPREVAERSIDLTEQFLFQTLGLQSTLTDLGIDSENFEVMARKACGGKILPGFKHLTPQDVEHIFEMCL